MTNLRGAGLTLNHGILLLVLVVAVCGSGSYSISALFSTWQ